MCRAARDLFCSEAGPISLNSSATNMKWIYPAFKFNNGLMPQSGSASHNAPVKRKEAGATPNCHIKPIREKWLRQICLFGVVRCHVSLKVLHMFRLEFIQNDWLHSLCFFFFSRPLSLFIFSMVAFVWKREAQSTIFRRLSSYYCKPSCLEGDLKFKCILSLIPPPTPPPLLFMTLCIKAKTKMKGEKKSSHCKTCMLRALGVFSFLF